MALSESSNINAAHSADGLALQQDVRDAISEMDAAVVCRSPALETVIAYCERVTQENAEWRRATAEWRTKAAVFEAERDELRTRIAEAPSVVCGESIYIGYAETVSWKLRGKLVSLVVREDKSV